MAMRSHRIVCATTPKSQVVRLKFCLMENLHKHKVRYRNVTRRTASGFILPAAGYYHRASSALHGIEGVKPRDVANRAWQNSAASTWDRDRI